MSTTIETPAADGDTLRERKKRQTREAIHSAALRLIEEHGLDGTTIEQICREADISTRTFFNYFTSKAGAALNLPETESLISDESAAAFRAATGRLVPAVCDLFAGTTDFGSGRAHMKEIIHRRPELISTFTEWMRGVRGQLLTLVMERTSNELEAELAVTLVMAAVGSLVHDSRDAGEEPTADRLREAVDRLVAVGTVELGPSA